MSGRSIKRITSPVRTMEGAGVPVNRVFGSSSETGETDPFLMMDHFQNDDPDLELPGFPWHPHRGIETITYMLQGSIRHEDSLGNRGILEAGDLQWMTAGSGIIHQEMPVAGESNVLNGFQLWANLSASQKMMDPGYQEIPAAEIPELIEDDGTAARIIAGKFRGKQGAVRGIASDPGYIDLSIPPHRKKEIRIDIHKNAFAYVFEGSALFKGATVPVVSPNLVLFDRGDRIEVQTADKGIRFLLISGNPFNEPVAWYGPIVMNTREQLVQAFREYEEGTFLNHTNRGGA